MPFSDAGFPINIDSLIGNITPSNSEIPWDTIEWIRAD
jgi:calpain-15